MEQPTLTLNIVQDEEYTAIEKRYQEKSKESGYSYIKLSLKYRTGDRVRSIGTMAFKQGRTIILGISNIRNLGQTETGSLTHDQIPDLDNIIRRALRSVDVQLLLFTSEESKILYYPLNKAASAGIIMAFYNGTMDPFDRINLLRIKEQDVETLLVLYYLSCIRYITELEMGDVLLEQDGFEAAADESALIPLAERARYRELKAAERPIPANHICLHALFGAYVVCRPVASKLDFSTWIKKRYSSLVSSMHQTPDPRETFQLQNGGNIINRISSARPILKRVVYNMMQRSYDDSKAQSVKTHTKMLTALSEMTTYALINRVITVGRAVVALNPLPEQLISYAEERKTILDELRSGGFPEGDIIYVHLIYPNKQCFVSSKYPDLIVTAMAIEKYLDPKTKTIENYKAKIQNPVLSESQIIQFLRHQSNESAMSTMTEEQIGILSDRLGLNMEPLVREAKKVLDLMAKQSH